MKTLEAFNIGVGLQIMKPSSMMYSEFKTTVNASDFFVENASAGEITSDKLYSRQFVSATAQFRILKEIKILIFKRFNLNVGSTFSNGQNLTYSFTENYTARGDSVWVTQGNNTDLYFSDSLYRIDTEYSTEVKNIGLFTEFWMSTEEKSGFAIGVGLLGQFAVENKLYLKHDTYFTTALYDQMGQPAWVKPSTSGIGTQGTVYSMTLANSLNNSVSLSSLYYFTPYVPIKFEARLSEGPVLKNITVDLNAKVGYEVQFSGANINAGRLFYQLGFGLNYYL